MVIWLRVDLSLLEIHLYLLLLDEPEHLLLLAGYLDPLLLSVRVDIQLRIHDYFVPVLLLLHDLHTALVLEIINNC